MTSPTPCNCSGGCCRPPGATIACCWRATGARRWRFCASSSVAAILLDLVMPVMDGFELLAELRVDPALAGIPVVIISSA